MIRRLPIALLPVLLAAGCASTTDLDVTRAQIVQQQQRLSQIETKISNDKLLDMINQVGSLQAEVAKLKGDVEVLNYNLQTTQKRQNDLYNDLDQRLTPLEGKTAATPAPGADSAARTDDGEAAAAPTPTADPVGAEYDKALAQLRNRNFKQAIPALKTFINANPTAKQTPDARYWLGVAYNAERQFQPAIDTYQRFIELSPTHARVPDAMRNIGGCQRDLGDTARAKSTWQQLINKYPNSDAAQKAKQQLSALK